jgi:hypothetical protein
VPGLIPTLGGMNLSYVITAGFTGTSQQLWDFVMARAEADAGFDADAAADRVSA